LVLPLPDGRGSGSFVANILAGPIGRLHPLPQINRFELDSPLAQLFLDTRKDHLPQIIPLRLHVLKRRTEKHRPSPPRSGCHRVSRLRNPLSRCVIFIVTITAHNSTRLRQIVAAPRWTPSHVLKASCNPRQGGQTAFAGTIENRTSSCLAFPKIDLYRHLRHRVNRGTSRIAQADRSAVVEPQYHYSSLRTRGLRSCLLPFADLGAAVRCVE